MPIIGRPEAPNKFAEISMRPKEAAATSSEDVKSAVERLGLGEKKPEIFKDAKSHNKMGKDEFLKLLSFQLQNQDPMNPMDQTKMAGELAQFSQLEQLANMRTAIEGSTKNDAIEEKFLASSFLGKRVLTEGGSLDLKADGATDINFSLDENAKTVLVRVMDGRGGMVAEIKQENLGKGNHQLSWDGVQFDGYRAAAGKYALQVLAFDEVNRPVTAMTKASGLVQAVAFENGEAILTVDGKKVSLKSIDKIELPQAAGGLPSSLAKDPSSKPAPEIQVGKPMASLVPVAQAAKAYEAQKSSNEGLVDYSR